MVEQNPYRATEQSADEPSAEEASTPAGCLLAPLGAVVGIVIGHLVSMELADQALQAIEAEHPGEYVCGMFMLPYLFWGIVCGAVGGAFVGGVAAYAVRRL